MQVAWYTGTPFAGCPKSVKFHIIQDDPLMTSSMRFSIQHMALQNCHCPDTYLLLNVQSKYYLFSQASSEFKSAAILPSH